MPDLMLKYSVPADAKILISHPPIKAGTTVQVLGKNMDQNLYLIAHESIKNHSGHGELDFKNTIHQEHCVWVRLDEIEFLKKGKS